MIKFIVFKNEYSGNMIPIVFPAVYKHSDMASLIGNDNNVPVEAGFVRIDGEGKMHPYGESISLRLQSSQVSIDAFRALNSENY